jgi:hypothetical protein
MGPTLLLGRTDEVEGRIAFLAGIDDPFPLLEIMVVVDRANCARVSPFVVAEGVLLEPMTKECLG